jgi:hypothetical protein
MTVNKDMAVKTAKMGYGTKHCQYCQKHGINHQTLLCNYTNIPSDAEVYDEEHITYVSVF